MGISRRPVCRAQAGNSNSPSERPCRPPSPASGGHQRSQARLLPHVLAGQYPIRCSYQSEAGLHVALDIYPPDWGMEQRTKGGSYIKTLTHPFMGVLVAALMLAFTTKGVMAQEKAKAEKAKTWRFLGTVYSNWQLMRGLATFRTLPRTARTRAKIGFPRLYRVCCWLRY